MRVIELKIIFIKNNKQLKYILINLIQVVGTNKLELEKNALMKDHNRIFNKVISLEPLEEG